MKLNFKNSSGFVLNSPPTTQHDNKSYYVTTWAPDLTCFVIKKTLNKNSCERCSTERRRSFINKTEMNRWPKSSCFHHVTKNKLCNRIKNYAKGSIVPDVGQSWAHVPLALSSCCWGERGSRDISPFFHTCTATLTLSRHYPVELYMWRQVVESVGSAIKRTLPCPIPSLVQRLCNVRLSPKHRLYIKRPNVWEFTVSEWACWWHFYCVAHVKPEENKHV